MALDLHQWKNQTNAGFLMLNLSMPPLPPTNNVEECVAGDCKHMWCVCPMQIKQASRLMLQSCISQSFRHFQSQLQRSHWLQRPGRSCLIFCRPHTIERWIDKTDRKKEREICLNKFLLMFTLERRGKLLHYFRALV